MLIRLCKGCVVSPTYCKLQELQVKRYIRFWEWQDNVTLGMFFCKTFIVYNIVIFMCNIRCKMFWNYKFWTSLASVISALRNLKTHDKLFPISNDLRRTSIFNRINYHGFTLSRNSKSPRGWALWEVTHSGGCPKCAFDLVVTGMMCKFFVLK